MRIAQVSPLYESVPPHCYGGTERVVSYLTEELVRQGHDVTLFASGDSVTEAELIAPCPRSLRLDDTCVDQLAHHIVMLEQVAFVAVASYLALRGELTIGVLYAVLAYKSQFMTGGKHIIEKAIAFRMLRLHLGRHLRELRIRGEHLAHLLRVHAERLSVHGLEVFLLEREDLVEELSTTS